MQVIQTSIQENKPNSERIQNERLTARQQIAEISANKIKKYTFRIGNGVQLTLNIHQISDCIISIKYKGMKYFIDHINLDSFIQTINDQIKISEKAKQRKYTFIITNITKKFKDLVCRPFKNTLELISARRDGYEKLSRYINRHVTVIED